ncbi:MAG: RNA methylase [Ignavibacteria bacterium]|nr:MAG: RNA methylase [Ignavibacteria bacterium]KAF0157633.1 MAG: RNA methylase [Ignavibacteria bacterium]
MIELSENISNYIFKYFGEEYLRQYKSYYLSQYKPYLRFAQNAKADQLISRLRSYGITLEKVDGVPFAYQVLEGSSVAGKTLEFILGKYYIQSLSSMIPAHVLNPSSSDKVLDLCAAPGSKATQLAEMMSNCGTLIANEISTDRLKSLVFNVDKMNLVNTGILHGRGELLSTVYQNYFDKILVDAPCSALGITQKKGEVSNWWNENKLAVFTETQIKLLVAAIKASKPGGQIVYSTCTLSVEENELMLNRVLQKYPVKLVEIVLPVKSMPALSSVDNVMLNNSVSLAHRIVPWEINSEGFFVAKLIKTEETERIKEGSRFPHKTMLVSANSMKIKKQLEILSEYFGICWSVLENYNYLLRSKDIYFVDAAWHSHNLDSFVRIGSKLGSIEKRGYIQLHTLAAQIFADKITKNVIELSEKKEIETYLRGGTIKRDFGITGQMIVKYNEDVIGTAVVSKEGLKSQFPREYRTQEIVLPNVCE